jgi:hypothetical protein
MICSLNSLIFFLVFKQLMALVGNLVILSARIVVLTNNPRVLAVLYD